MVDKSSKNQIFFPGNSNLANPKATKADTNTSATILKASNNRCI